MCWTLCFRKNLDPSKLLISSDDAFKIWCIFNFLSEDRYPLMIVTEEVGVKYLKYMRYVCTPPHIGLVREEGKLKMKF